MYEWIVMEKKETFPQLSQFPAPVDWFLGEGLEMNGKAKACDIYGSTWALCQPFFCSEHSSS